MASASAFGRTASGDFTADEAPLVAVSPTGSAASGDGQMIPAASVEPAKDVCMVSCDFLCGTCKPLDCMFRTNARAKPVCHPCHNARRAIAAAASKDPAAKQALADLQKSDPDGYKAKVRACRVEPRAMVDYQQRRMAVHTAVSQIRQTSGIQEFRDFTWLSKRKFVNHMVHEEDMTEDGAVAKWDSMLKDPSVPRRQYPGEEVKLPVQGNPKTRVYRGRELEKGVGSSSGLSSTSDVQCALEAMAGVGSSAGSFTSPLMGDFGSVCRPGAAAGSGAAPLLNQDVTAPTANMIIPSSDFQGPVPEAKPERTLKRQFSAQGEEPAGQRKRAKSGPVALGGVTGQLLQLRQSGLDCSKQLLDRFSKGTKHLARTVTQVYAKAKMTPMPDVVKAVERFNSIVDELKAVSATVKTWTIASAPQGLAKIEAYDVELTELSEHLQDALGHCQAAKAEIRKKEVQERANVKKIRNKATASYNSCPDVLVRYLYDHDGLASATASGQIKSKFHIVGADADFFDTKTPALFALKADCTPSGHAVSGLIDSIGKARFEQASAACVQVSSAQDSSSSKRLEPQGLPSDTIERLEWVPEQWRSGQYCPTALRGLGAPYCVTIGPGNSMSGDEGWPIVGVGQFLTLHKGQLTVCVWPVDSILSRGASVGNQYQFLFKEMGNKVFSEWASQSMLFGRVLPGETLWIPYGWYGTAISRIADPVEYARAMIQPCVTAAMAQECAEWPAVSNYLASYLGEKLASKSSSLYESWARSAVEWLRKTASPREVGAVASGAGGSGPAALKDGSVDETAEETLDNTT